MLLIRRGWILRLNREIRKSPANKSLLSGVNQGRSQSNKKSHRKSTQPDFILMRFGRLGPQSLASMAVSRLVGLSCETGIKRQSLNCQVGSLRQSVILVVSIAHGLTSQDLQIADRRLSQRRNKAQKTLKVNCLNSLAL